MSEPLFDPEGTGITPEVGEFVTLYIDSFITWELLVFLHDNPEFMGNILDIAAVLGRDERDVLPAVRAGIERGFVIAEVKAGETFYWYTAESEWRYRVDAVMQAAQDTNVRLSIIAQILRRQAEL
ncbi:MAG: hypothetical protein ACYC55_09470 [Candidatus Geothermincolia bacterium]